jgi:hypothetical protein
VQLHDPGPVQLPTCSHTSMLERPAQPVRHARECRRRAACRWGRAESAATCSAATPSADLRRIPRTDLLLADPRLASAQHRLGRSLASGCSRTRRARPDGCKP